MRTLTNYFDYKNLVNADTNYIEVVTDGLYKYAKEAITNNRVEEVIEDFQKLSNEFERIGNSLDLSEEITKKSYCFGKISSLSKLVIDLSEALNTVASYESLFQDYPKLKPALKEISLESDISGVKLREKLGMSSSALSNFIQRVSDYNLIVVRKVGKSNYYSLSTEGKKALAMPDSVKDSSDGGHSAIKYMAKMLDSIAEEMRSDQPNTINVLIKSHLYEFDIGEKNILKSKVDAVFSSRDAHVKSKLFGVLRILNQYKFDENKALPYLCEDDSNVYYFEGTY